VRKADLRLFLPAWVPVPVKAFLLGYACSGLMLALIGFCVYVSLLGVPWENWGAVLCGIGVAFVVLLSVAVGFPAWCIEFFGIKGLRRVLPFAAGYAGFLTWGLTWFLPGRG